MTRTRSRMPLFKEKADYFTGAPLRDRNCRSALRMHHPERNRGDLQTEYGLMNHADVPPNAAMGEKWAPLTGGGPEWPAGKTAPNMAQK